MLYTFSPFKIINITSTPGAPLPELFNFNWTKSRYRHKTRNAFIIGLPVAN